MLLKIAYQRHKPFAAGNKLNIVAIQELDFIEKKTELILSVIENLYLIDLRKINFNMKDPIHVVFVKFNV